MEFLVRACAFATLVGLTFIPLEHLFGRRDARRSGRLADLGFATIGDVIVQVTLIAILGGLLAILEPFSVGAPLWANIEHRATRVVVEIATGLVVFEGMGYAYHRAAHRIPALWRLHAVHHSSESMDWLASFRQHPLEIVATTVVQNVPLILLGLPLSAHLMVLLLLKLNTVFVHANLPIASRWWTRWIATPPFHHRHHQRDGVVANYAAMFPWIDRLFGTFCARAAGPVGIREPMPARFVGLLIAPFR